MRSTVLALTLFSACTAAPTVPIASGPRDASAAPDAAPDAAPLAADAGPRASADGGARDASPTEADAEVACAAQGASCAEAACCAGTFCETNAYLDTWHTCVPALADGEHCTADAVCASGHCRPDTFVCGPEACGAEGQACFGLDFPCCVGLGCDVPADSYGPGQCAPVRALGEPCAGDAQCASGRCVAGRCAEPVPPGEATFARVFAEVLARNGCGSAACHGGGAGGLAWVDEDAAYRALVGVSAVTCAGEQRVAPGEPDASALWRKIAPGVAACGAKMPPSVGAVSPAAADLVRAWIAAGALR